MIFKVIPTQAILFLWKEVVLVQSDFFFLMGQGRPTWHASTSWQRRSPQIPASPAAMFLLLKWWGPHLCKTQLDEYLLWLSWKRADGKQSSAPASVLGRGDFTESHWFPYSSWSTPPLKVLPFLSVTSLKPGSAPSWLKGGADLRKCSHWPGLLRLQSNTLWPDDTQAVWWTPVLLISLILPSLKEKVMLGRWVHIPISNSPLISSSIPGISDTKFTCRENKHPSFLLLQAVV